MQSEQHQQQQQHSLSFQSCYGPSPHSQQQYGRRGAAAYPSVPPPASAPTASYNFGSSGSGSSGGGGGLNPGVIAGAAVLRGSGQGLGALVSGSSGSSSSRVGEQQYHPRYHQHPGLPTSAPSGTQSDVLYWEPPQWLPDR